MPRWCTAFFVAIIMTLPCIGMAESEKRKIFEFIEIHSFVMARFEYDDAAINPEDEKFKYYPSFGPVYGDCDDFMSAVYYELWKRGYEPEALAYDFEHDDGNTYRHAIVCAEGYCFDNNFTGPYDERRLTKHVEDGDYHILARGELNNTAMYDLGIHEIIASMAAHAA